MTLSSLWHIRVTGDDIEQISFTGMEALDNAVEGMEVLSPSEARLFVSSEEEPEDVIALLESLNYKVTDCARDDGRDWITQVAESWSPIEIGTFSVIPTMNENPRDLKIDSKTIYIIPSSGFGTGASLTTQSTLLLLERVSSMRTSVKSVLDVGTGSGILAIACAKLFEAEIHAIDISDQAVTNAQENVELNCASSTVRVERLVTSEVEASYDLVVANIEIGIQLDLLRDYERLVKRDGHLCLGGLRDSIRADQVLELLNFRAVSPASWENVETITLGEWSAFLFKRV